MKRQPRWTSAAVLALVGAITLAGRAGSTPVTDGLMLWLDATDSSTLYEDSALTKLATVGSSIGGWKDKSGNDYHATQETAASRPVYLNDVMNGKAGLHFNAGELDGMLVDPALEVVRPFTAFVVNKYSGPAKGRTLQSTSGNWLLGLWSGRIAHYAEGWVSSSLAPIAFEGEVYVSDSVSDTAETYYTANGYDLTLDSAPVGEPMGLALNGAGWAKEYSDTDIAEVLVFDRTLSAGELTSVRNYLYDKYDAALLEPGELNDVNFGKLGVFNGGDAGEGLDLDGTFQYAVDIGGNGGHQVRDALFSSDSRGGFTVSASERNNPWGAASTFGDSEDDIALGQVMNSIRWSTGDGVGLDTVKVTLEGIIPDAEYKLQLLFAERCCDRSFDVFVDGKEAVNRLHVPSLVGTPDDPINNSTTDAAVYTLEFIGGDSGVLEIEVDGRRGFRTDPNALIHALTLEVDLELRGDFNFDGKIDEADFQVLANGMFEGNGYRQGDFNLDGQIDFTDFRALKSAAAAQAVPEPGTWVLLGLGGLLLAFHRRRLALSAQRNAR
jgi:hypothetical protein